MRLIDNKKEIVDDNMTDSVYDIISNVWVSACSIYMKQSIYVCDLITLDSLKTDISNEINEE